MVAQRTKSLIIEELAKRSDHHASHVFLLFFVIRSHSHTFGAVCSGHKLAKPLFAGDGNTSQSSRLA
jgi:hypothetical protein